MIDRDSKEVRMPFNYCNLALKEAEDPYMAIEKFSEAEQAKISAPTLKCYGVVFDILGIVPFVKAHGTNPVTGSPLQQVDLVKLTFHRNDEGQIHCPVTYKPLTISSHVIAIKESGNVFSYEAYQELNREAKNYRDLLTDEPFDPKGVVLINDPKWVFKRQKSAALKSKDAFINQSLYSKVQKEG